MFTRFWRAAASSGRFIRNNTSPADSTPRRLKHFAPHVFLAASSLAATIPILSCESVATVPDLPSDINIKDCSVTLYQFESCPFCRKARAVLDLCNIPYNVVEVNPLTKSETKSFASDYKKVPIVLVEDPTSGRSYQIRDSKIIIKAILEASKLPVGGDCPNTPLPLSVSLNDETQLDSAVYAGMDIDAAWIKWVEQYLLQLVVVNIYGTMEESKETFDYLLTHKDFGWLAREASYWAGSIVMNQVAKSRLKKFKHIQGKHREVFFSACGDLGTAAKTAGGFLGGSLPSAADLNAYGVIRSLEGTKTLREAIGGQAGNEFKAWYERMNQAVGESRMKSKVNGTRRGTN